MVTMMLVGIPVDAKYPSQATPKECADEMSAHLKLIGTERCKRAFSVVFNYFAPRLRSYALKQMGNEALAMEMVQDTMSNVCHHQLGFLL
jgi:RNA polymerase sigma-70 factor (ECF subfamily)